VKKILNLTFILAIALFLGFALALSAEAVSPNVTLNVDDSGGNPLDGVKLYYNDYGNHYVYLGTTTGGTVTATLPAGLSTNFKAVILGHSVQIIPGTVPCTVDFQTSEFIVHVKHTNSSAYEGIAVYWEDYSNHWYSMGDTNSNGDASIELFPGNYNFRASKNHTNQTGYLKVDTSGTSGTIDFQTADFVVHVDDSENAAFEDIAVYFGDYTNHWISMGTTDSSGNASIELFPGNRKFRAYKDHTQQIGSLEVNTSGNSGTINFQTALAEGFARDCSNDNPIQGIAISFGDYTNHWLSMGLTGSDGKASIELFPGTDYDFRGYTQHTQQINTVDLPPSGVTTEFNPTRLCLNFGSTVMFNDYGNHWQSVPCGTYLFPGTYDFKFGDYIQSLTISGCAFEGDVFIFKTVDSNGDPLPNIPIYRNDYGNHYVSVGTTDGNGVLFTTDLPSGTWKFRASLRHTNQYFTSGPGLITFQTSEFNVHVKKTDGSDFAGINTYYNDYGNHYLSMGTTDTSGNASIELFPGNYRFKAYKDHTQQTGYLEVPTSGSSGTIDFQTSLFVVHVKDSTGFDYPGIRTYFNDYGNHYLSMGYTDTNGNTDIELFPGNYKFKAYKDHTQNTGFLAIAASGATDTIEFQTALAVGYARDCDSGDPIPGILMSFNDYGNHWLTMGTTGSDGKASRELFPGTSYKFRGYTQHTYEVKTADLAPAGVVVEFNPTRISFTYPGTVRFNDYGNHWQIVTDGTYLFAGTYDFKFDSMIVPITIIGCSMDCSIAFVHIETSTGTPIEGDNVYYYYWPLSTTFAGTTNANGDLAVLLPDPKTSAQFIVEDYGFKQSKTQNIIMDPWVNFVTVNVTMQLQDHDGDGTTDDLTGNEAVELKVYKWPTTKVFGSGATLGYQESMELLPLAYDFTMTYEGVAKTVSQDVSVDPVVVFQTKEYTLTLVDHSGGTSNLIGDATNATYYKWPYTGTFGDGDLLSSDGYSESMDLFDFTYNFTIKYVLHSQTISGSGDVQFQTGQVDDTDGTCYEYYKWPATGSFTNLMELLPLTYEFRFSNPSQPNVTCAVLAGQTRQVPSCTTP
jgi:hypothetical protein